MQTETLRLSNAVLVSPVSVNGGYQFQIHVITPTSNKCVAHIGSMVMAMRIRRLLLADEKAENRKWRDIQVKIWDTLARGYVRQ